MQYLVCWLALYASFNYDYPHFDQFIHLVLNISINWKYICLISSYVYYWQICLMSYELSTLLDAIIINVHLQMAIEIRKCLTRWFDIFSDRVLLNLIYPNYIRWLFHDLVRSKMQPSIFLNIKRIESNMIPRLYDHNHNYSLILFLVH
jgi:hypothetical protein